MQNPKPTGLFQHWQHFGTYLVDTGDADQGAREVAGRDGAVKQHLHHTDTVQLVAMHARVDQQDLTVGVRCPARHHHRDQVAAIHIAEHCASRENVRMDERHRYVRRRHPACVRIYFIWHSKTLVSLPPPPRELHAQSRTQHVKNTRIAIPCAGLGKARPEPESIRLAPGQGLDVQLVNNGVAVLEIGALASRLVARQVGIGDGSNGNHTRDGLRIGISRGRQNLHNGAVGLAEGIGGDTENLRDNGMATNEKNEREVTV